MNKKILWLLTIFLVGAVAIAEAQQPKRIPRIGFLSSTGDPNNPGSRVEAFQRGLRDFAYIERKNILVEYRYIEGKPNRVPDLLAELLQLNVDILVLGTLTGIRAAR